MFRIIAQPCYQIQFRYTGETPPWCFSYDPASQRFVCDETHSSYMNANLALHDCRTYMQSRPGDAEFWLVQTKQEQHKLLTNEVGLRRMINSPLFVLGTALGTMPRWRLPTTKQNNNGEYMLELRGINPLDDFKTDLRNLYQPEDFPLLTEVRDEVVAALRAMPGEVILPDLDDQ